MILNVLFYFFIAVITIFSVLLVFIVLMQRPKQEGLGSAFGGGMTDNLFGAQTTNVLQKFTVYLIVIYFISAIALSIINTKRKAIGAIDTSDLKTSKIEEEIEVAKPETEDNAGSKTEDNAVNNVAKLEETEKSKVQEEAKSSQAENKKVEGEKVSEADVFEVEGKAEKATKKTKKKSKKNAAQKKSDAK